MGENPKSSITNDSVKPLHGDDSVTILHGDGSILSAASFIAVR